MRRRMKMNKGRAVWTKAAEEYFRQKWPAIECNRIAGEEANYAGEDITQKDIKRPGSVANEWAQLGWIKWVSGAYVPDADLQEPPMVPKQWKPWMPGYEE